MAYNNLETSLALESLRAPLDPFPMTVQERYLNEMRIRYRTYYVEYDVNERVIMLPKMFAADFGGEISRYATLVDPHNNHLEVLVEKINDDVYFTRGSTSLRDFYDIQGGAWLVLMYAGFGHFGLNIHDRVQHTVIPPTFAPPMKLVIDRFNVPPNFVDRIIETTDDLAYSHDPSFFDVQHEKALTYYDVSSGYLMLPYDGFGEHVLDETTTTIKLVDDCGNAWQCTMIYVTFPCKHFRVGGQWSRLVAARRLAVGTGITIGGDPDAHNDTLYVIVDV